MYNLVFKMYQVTTAPKKLSIKCNKWGTTLIVLVIIILIKTVHENLKVWYFYGTKLLCIVKFEKVRGILRLKIQAWPIKYCISRHVAVVKLVDRNIFQLNCTQKIKFWPLLHNKRILFVCSSRTHSPYSCGNIPLGLRVASRCSHLNYL